jgi:hypothetical protein
MKKFLAVVVLASAALCGCEKEQKGGIDPNSTISIRGKMSLKSTGTPAEVKFVVRYASGFRGFSESDNKAGYGRGFSDTQRDSVNYLLKWWGVDVVYEDGNGQQHLGNMLTDIKNIYVTAFFDKDGRPINPRSSAIPAFCDYDTIAYIPNEVVMRARKDITAAFAAGNYQRCYQLFDSAYVFVPMIKDKWKKYVDELR